MSTRRDQQGTTHCAGSAQPVCCVSVDGSLTTLGLALARPLVIHGGILRNQIDGASQATDSTQALPLCELD